MPIPAATPDNVRHALNRWTFGPTPALTTSVTQSGLSAYLEAQLTQWRNADVSANAAVSAYQTLKLTAPQIWYGYWSQYGLVGDELQSAAILRATAANNQLFERMVEFWGDHFNIDLYADAQWVLKPVDDREVVRKNALGRFEDLLLASARSVSMLTFLDQTKSTGLNPNENYARELLELHTLGVDGGYTETDVRETARLLTGWGWEWNSMAFYYNAAAHDSRPATILGRTYGSSASGYQDGVDLIRDLARHPSTARHLARKICRRFVSDNPSAALVQSVANAYLAANTDIAATLRHLFNQSEFWLSVGMKTRRPMDTLIAFFRATSAKFLLNTWNAGQLKRAFVYQLETTGQAPFRWGTPDGYPDDTETWTHPSGLLSRWNVMLTHALTTSYGVQMNMSALLGSPQPATAGALVDRVATVILSRPPTTAERDAFLSYLGKPASSAIEWWLYDGRARHLAALVAASPAFLKR